MLNDESRLAVEAFLRIHPYAWLREVSTLKEGYAICFKPIPHVCGAEIHCASDVYNEVRVLLRKFY